MQLLKFLLLFRLKQGFRMLKSVGCLLIIALPLLFIYSLSALHSAKYTNSIVIAFVLCLIPFSIHFYRKDGRFLQHLNCSRWIIFLIEYSILLLPITLAVLIQFNKWEVFAIVHSFTLLILFFPPGLLNSQTSKSKPIPSFIPVEIFEWRSGLRQYFYYALLLQIIGLSLCTFVGTALIITLLWGMMAVTFYEAIEQKELFENIHFKYGLLKRKVITHSLLFHTFLLPHYLLFLIFHTNYWYLILAAATLAELLLLFAIFYKYAVYRPARRRAYNQTATGLFLGGFLVPFLAPGSIWYLITFWRRAIKRIQYFYAKNK